MSSLMDVLVLQLGIPIQVILPTFVQKMGRKLFAMLLQLIHRWFVWLDLRVHVAFFWQHIALAGVALLTGGDDILP